MAILKVYGLTETDMEKLKQIALDKTGKDSVSHLARELLLNLLRHEPISSKKSYRQVVSGQSCRLEIKPSEKEYEILKKLAEEHQCTANYLVLTILRHYLTSQITLSTAELTALYQSNYQLLRIGRNINQIARHLNTMESVEFSIKHIESLQKTIDEHTQKISAMMTANKKRFAS